MNFVTANWFSVKINRDRNIGIKFQPGTDQTRGTLRIAAIKKRQLQSRKL